MDEDSPLTMADLRGIDWKALIQPKEEENTFLRDMQERADARLTHAVPFSPEERLAGFQRINFRPHGLYLPDDAALRERVLGAARNVGLIPDLDHRLRRYADLQDRTGDLETQGMAGHWTGQQGVSRSKARYRLVAWGRRGGKLLSLDSRLPSPYTAGMEAALTMGTVKVGDSVYGPDGKPHRVTMVSPVVISTEAYRVCFSDGSEVVADAEHLWTVETKETRRSGSVERNCGYIKIRPYHPPVTMTTRELIPDLKIGGRESRYSIPVCAPVEYPEQSLPIDPYVLGVWLGDGDARQGTWTKPDVEVADEVRRRGLDVVRSNAPSNRCARWRVVDLTRHLRSEGLLHNKHIPPAYFYGSVQQRLDLVRGLMDTDGYADVRGKCEFTSTDRRLADGMQELLESLGQVVGVREGRAMLNGEDYGPKYRISWKPTLDVFILPRKLERQRVSLTKIKADRQRRYITSVVPTESQAMRCISIDSPDHLYLTNHYIATHNSSIAAAEAVALAISRPRSVVWCCAPIMRHVGRVFDMVLQMLADAQVLVRVRRDTNQEKLVVLDNGSRIEGVPLDNILGAAGAAVDLAIVDEAAQITADAWERAIIPPLMDRNGQALLISSYEGDEGFFAKKAEQAKAQIIRTGGDCPWAVFQDASYDVNFYFFPQGRQTPQLLEAEADMDPINFLEQFGAIPAGARDRVYPEFRERIHTGNYPFDPNHPVVLAVDPSTGGNAYAVAVLQDYGSYVVQIDEFYESHMAVEDISPILDAREWRLNVTDLIVDGASPVEVRRWIDRGWPAFGIGDGKGVNKPEIRDRIPILKIWLREPIGFYQIWRDRIDYYLAERGLPPGSEKQLSREQQNALMVQVNESFSDERMSIEEIQHMRQFARFHIDRSCVFTIEEFKRYKYVRPHRDGANLPERPGDSYNHIMDGLGYFFWHFKLFETRQGTDRTMVQPNGPVDQDVLATSVEPILLTDVQRRRSRWIQEARERNSPSGYRDVLRVKAY